MKVAICQINPTVGSINKNKEKHLIWYEKAKKLGAQLIVFPELSLLGYPPQDLLLRKKFIEEAHKAIIDLSASFDIPTIIGSTFFEKKNLYNSLFLIANKSIEKIYKKILLPTYDVFDEARYFTPGEKPCVTSIKKDNKTYTIGFQICEDLWDSQYNRDLIREMNDLEVDCIINISASPYTYNKFQDRVELIKSKVKQYNITYIYCNLVGAQDEIIFDGQSVAINNKNDILKIGKAFEEDLVLFDLNQTNKVKIKSLPKEEELFKALVLGVRDYFEKSYHQEAIIGLSGGIDSALTAVIAKEALGCSNVHCVFMPSKYSSDSSLKDSKKLANNLNIDFQIIPINDLVFSFEKSLNPFFEGTETGIAEENIQSRIRGNLLMSLSNKFGWLVLSTGNKTEMALGYCTLYGDMNGGLSVISDLSKSEVYAISKWINVKHKSEVIPNSILTKAPSAELRHNQKDPFDYELISPMVAKLIEQSKSPTELIEMGYEESLISDISKRLRVNEFKRRQAAPSLRVTSKAFGIGRRVPIINQFDELH